MKFAFYFLKLLRESKQTKRFFWKLKRDVAELKKKRKKKKKKKRTLRLAILIQIGRRRFATGIINNREINNEILKDLVRSKHEGNIFYSRFSLG